eukprot:403331687
MQNNKKLSRQNLKSRSRFEVLDIIKGVDIYGQQFSLTFQGQQRFKTWPGALASMLVIGTIIAYTVARFSVMLNYEDNKTSVTPQLVDITQFDKAFQANQYGFDIAAGTRPKNLEDRIGSIKFYFVNVDNYVNALNVSVRNRTDYELETVPCGLDNYNYTNKEEVVLKQVSIANCVKDKSMLKMKGTLYGKNAQFLEIRVQPCIDPSTINNVNSTICATFEEQTKWWSGVNLLVYPVNTYFDFNDLDSSVKYFIDDTIFFPIQPTLGKQSFIYVRQSFTNLNDKFFSFENGKNITLYSIQRQKDYIMETAYRGITYVSVQVRLDPYQDTYSRTVYGLMGVIGDVGGVQTILLVFGSLITGMIAERLLYAKMMNQIYHAKVRSLSDKQRNLFGSIKKAQKLPAKSNIKYISNNEYKSDINTYDEEKGRNAKTADNPSFSGAIMRKFSTYKSQNSTGGLLEISRRKIMNTIVNRLVFIYSSLDILNEIMTCACLRRYKTKKQIQDYRQQFLYYKAKQKLESNFDALSLMRFMHQMQLLGPILLDENQQLLMHFQKKQLLDSEPSTEEEDLDDQVTIEALNNGKNPFVKLMVLGRVNQRVQDLLNKKKLNQIDVKLLKGMFTRQTNDTAPQKGINETFRPNYQPQGSAAKQGAIVRKFKSFVLRDSVDEATKSREKLSVLESIDEFIDQKEYTEYIRPEPNNTIISKIDSVPRTKTKGSKRYTKENKQTDKKISDDYLSESDIYPTRKQKSTSTNASPEKKKKREATTNTVTHLKTQDVTQITYFPKFTQKNTKRIQESLEAESIIDDDENPVQFHQHFIVPSARREYKQAQKSDRKREDSFFGGKDMDSSRVKILNDKQKAKKRHNKFKNSQKLNFPDDSD